MPDQHVTEIGFAAAPRANVLTDVIIGAVGGAVGVWAMDQLGWMMLRHESQHTLTRDLWARQGPTAHADIKAQVRSVQESPLLGRGAAGPVRTATQVSGVSDPNQQPGPAATAFHYGLGILPGAAYALARRASPWLSTGYGGLYGLGLFVVMDETAAPLTGIASGPARYPWQAHARGLIAHLVLGVTTETLLRVTDRFRWTGRR